jgi:A/G-specific adenine glycosylase
VLHYWTGLGYYARGRNLHRAAQRVAVEHAGRFPDDVAALATLPGVGRSTAGAIAAIAFGRRAPILDGNVKRVLARYHAVAGDPGASAVQRTLWQHAEAHTPGTRSADYAQAMMDLGATLCTRTRPRCQDCPVTERCEARRLDAVADYPVRKPRRDKPVRQARMFLVTDAQGRCLLEQRPLSGLWGGLWTPPERPSATTVGQLCHEFGIRPDSVESTRPDDAFRHTFSHFHLDIEPVHVRLSVAPAHVADRDDLCWYDANAVHTRRIGLSAPAARLLISATVNGTSRERPAHKD